MLARCILLSVCLRLSQFSQSSFMQYMGLCVSSLPISLMMIVRIHVLVVVLLLLLLIVKSEVWPVCYCLGIGHEAMVWAVCLFIFLSPLSIFSLWPSKVLANQRRHYICNIFSHWLRNWSYHESLVPHWHWIMVVNYIILLLLLWWWRWWWWWWWRWWWWWW